MTQHTIQRVIILGDLKPVVFLPWIDRHAAKLGLSQSIIHVSDTRIEIDFHGQEDLIDMMEVGCFLGPIDVWVDAIERL
ncbi:acylphosphatase [Agrobacterium larrymoorei]|uniref:acylphosphatase n=1 Tax=Agrobacterium larrymoorei TaxID=160699 RepID=UPI001574C220|nr:acylphosphatase [Agrobacterium larrymoorei]NTJ43710.1 acylphosphatase [Agrobacterium larrymoorei]